MKTNNRRAFIQSAGILLATAASGTGFSLKKEPLLSFSTLGCPDWSFDKTMDFAVQHGYRGLEIRGIQRQMDLPKCPEFSSAANRAATIRKMKERGLNFVG